MKNLTMRAPQSFTASGTSQVMLGADPRRYFAEIANPHPTAIAYLSYGTNPAVLGKGTVLMPNGGTTTLIDARVQINVISTGTPELAIQAGG